MASLQNEPQAVAIPAVEDMTTEVTEITRDEALKSLLTNEDLSDLTLRGSDGSLVIANRCLLASRSPVFGRMLFGQFAEASKTTIDLGYDGKILQAIVEYIYTDQVPTLEDKEKGDENDETPWDITFVRLLVNLIAAADYFALPQLRRMIEMIAEKKLKKNEEVATLFLAVCVPDCDTTKVLQNMAVQVVKRNPKILLESNKSSLAQIHPSYVEEILKEDKLPMDEYSCFQLLQSWANASGSNADRLNAQESDQSTSRKRSAAQMISHVDLTGIAATELSTIVASSGLVTTEQLCEAYKVQALRAQKRHRISFTQWRRGYVWESSRTTTLENHTNQHRLERLDCPILKSGVHKWSIKVLQRGLNTPVLGVISTRWPIEDGVSLLHHRGGWGISSAFAGHALNHDNGIRRNHLPYVSEGSTVSLTLDVEQGGGTLTASIDGGASFQIFSDMCQDHGEGHGFVPAVSVILAAGIEFLGFEEVP